MKITAVVVIVLLGALLAYTSTGTEPLDSKSMLESAVQQVKDEKGDITPEQESLLKVQIAVADFTASSRRPPKSIAELVPKYFDSVPIDPRTNAPMEFPLDKSASPTIGGDKIVTAQVDTDSIIINGETFLNPNTMILDDFVYDPSGRRDPFQPFDFSGASEVRMDLPPLERYSIGQLKLSSTLALGNEYTAIIEDATGRGYTVRKGSRVGTQNGIVVKITADSVFVVETRTDFTGKKTRETVEMKIQRVETDLDGQATYNRNIMNQRQDKK